MKKWIADNKAHLILYGVCAFMAYALINQAINGHKQKEADRYEYSYNMAKYQVVKELNTIRDTIYKRSEITSIEVPDSVKHRIDSLTKLTNSQSKELKRYVSIFSQADYSKAAGKKDTVFVNNHDTIRVYSYSDRWINYKAFAGDSLIFNPLSVKDSLSFFFVDKKIGNKVFKELKVLNHNPYSYISDIQNINLEQPKSYRPFGIGISAGATYYNGGFQPYIGIGINYTIIKIK